MIIKDGILLSVEKSDVDSDGVLRVPDNVIKIDKNSVSGIDELKVLNISNSVKSIEEFAFSNNINLNTVFFGESITEIKNNSFLGSLNIKTIQIPNSWYSFDKHFIMPDCEITKIIRNENGYKSGREYNIENHNGIYFHINNRRKIAGIDILYAQRLRFKESGLSGSHNIIIKHMGNTFCNKSLSDSLKEARAFRFFSKTNIIFNNYIESEILKSALEQSLSYKQNKLSKSEEKYFQNKNIKEIAIATVDFVRKYEKSENYFELFGLNLDKLEKTVFPICGNSGKSSTKYFKRKPINDDLMHKILKNKSHTPGAFPFEWLSDISPEQRGDITKKLHELFRNSTIKMYSDSDFSEIDTDNIIKEMVSDIYDLINKKFEINYLSNGNFGKVFKISGMASEYAWKIYHYNVTYKVFNEWGHDTEIQNSFLLSDKKYIDGIRFRKIFTAGISNKRAEQYMIYKFADGKAFKTPKDPYQSLKRFRVYDFFKDDNCIGNTLVDIGGININNELYNYSFLSKIIRIVIYRPWDDLYYVLKNNSKDNIKKAIDFIEKNCDGVPNVKRIRAKLEFLKNKTW